MDKEPLFVEVSGGDKEDRKLLSMGIGVLLGQNNFKNIIVIAEAVGDSLLFPPEEMTLFDEIKESHPHLFDHRIVINVVPSQETRERSEPRSKITERDVITTPIMDVVDMRMRLTRSPELNINKEMMHYMETVTECAVKFIEESINNDEPSNGITIGRF